MSSSDILPPPSKTRYLTVPDTATKKDSLKQYSKDEVKKVSRRLPRGSLPARSRFPAQTGKSHRRLFQACVRWQDMPRKGLHHRQEGSASPALNEERERAVEMELPAIEDAEVGIGSVHGLRRRSSSGPIALPSLPPSELGMGRARRRAPTTVCREHETGG